MKCYRILIVGLIGVGFHFEAQGIFGRKKKKTTEVQQKKDYDIDALSGSRFNRLVNLENTKRESIEFGGNKERPQGVKNTDNVELKMKEDLRQSAMDSIINNYKKQLENENVPKGIVDEIVVKLTDQLTQKHQADRVKDLKKTITTGDAYAQNETTRTKVGGGANRTEVIRTNKGGLHDRVYGNTRKAYNDYYDSESSSVGDAQQYKKAITKAYKEEIDVSLQDAVQFVKEGKITREQFMDVMTSLKKTMFIDFQDKNPRTDQYIDRRNTKVISLAKDGIFDFIELKKYIDTLETEALKEAQKAAKERDFASSSSAANQVDAAVEYSTKQETRAAADRAAADLVAKGATTTATRKAKTISSQQKEPSAGSKKEGENRVPVETELDGKDGESDPLPKAEGNDPSKADGNDSDFKSGEEPI